MNQLGLRLPLSWWDFILWQNVASSSRYERIESLKMEAGDLGLLSFVRGTDIPMDGIQGCLQRPYGRGRGAEWRISSILVVDCCWSCASSHSI